MTSEIAVDADRLYACIGKIVVRFQLIENGIAEVLASLLRMPEHEDIYRVSAAMSYAQKLNLMCDLYDERKNSEWPPINLECVRKALFSAEAFRNAVVHSLWFVGGEQSEWMRAKSELRTKGKLKTSSGPANIEALEEAIEHLSIINDWYLGRTARLTEATTLLSQLTGKLGSRAKPPQDNTPFQL